MCTTRGAARKEPQLLIPLEPREAAFLTGQASAAWGGDPADPGPSDTVQLKEPYSPHRPRFSGPVGIQELLQR